MSLSFADFIAAINANQGWINNTISMVVYLIALGLFLRGIWNLYEASTNPSDAGKARDGFIKMGVAGLLSSLSYSIAAVSKTVWNQSSITAYVVPGATTAEGSAVAVVVALAIILRLFGVGWFAQAVYRFSALSGGRSQVTGGGALIQLFFAAACVNIVAVVSLFQSVIGFKSTIADWLRQYGVG